MHPKLVVILWGIMVAQTANRACTAELPSAAAGDPAALVGQPADIAPSAYLFRSDRRPEENPPETEFLFAGAVKHEKAGVICGLLWEEPRPIERVELSWPKDAQAVPPPGDLVVRWLPHGNSSSWWSRRAAGQGKTSIVTAAAPQVSGDGRRYVYTLEALKPDTAADNLVVALKDGARPPAEPYTVPTVRVITPETWKLVDVEIEWGFQRATEGLAFDGRIEAYNGVIGTPQPLAGDAGTTMVSDHAWRSKPAGNSRRGIRVRLLYLGPTQNTPVWDQQARLEHANRTIVTVWTSSGSFSFLPADLEAGPILGPEYGFFVRATDGRQAASATTGAREFVKELAAQNLKTVRQRVREHTEQTWEGAMQAMHPGGNWPPYPQPEFEPAAHIEVPDGRLTDAWRCGAWHLLRVLKKDQQGRYVIRDYPYDALAHESHLIIRALDLQGMHQAARDGLARWLERDENQPARLDGLFADTNGAMSGVEWDWQHAGGPGVIQWQMVEHYLLTGDKDWLTRAAPKLQANADWMIRQRRVYLQDVPGRQRLWIRGLQPPHNIWDSTNWRPWYESNANYWFGLSRYAEVIADLDAEISRKYTAEAQAYAQDILAAVEKSLVLSPVVRVGDGTYRSFLPPAPYIRGPASRCMPTSFGSPEHTPGLYPDAIRGGVHLLNLSGLLPRSDPRAQGLLDVLEDRLLLEHHRLPMRTPDYDPAKHWFSHAGWYYQCGIERTANVHLQWDDVPNFLRSFYNQYAVDVVVGPYTFNEHTTRGPADKSFEEAAFLERLRNMLVMEEGASLWLARGTPRAWLAQGKRIAAKNMPTHFGAVGYEILSDVDHGRITASVELPSRRPPKAVLLRFRHPKTAPIKGVTVDGRPWTDFDAANEVVRLHGVQGTINVEAGY